MLVGGLLGGLLTSALFAWAWAGRAPMCWPWCLSAFGADLRTTTFDTCCACRSIISAASVPVT